MRLSGHGREVLVVVRREFGEAARGRSLVVGTAVLLILLAGYASFYGLFRRGSAPRRVGVAPSAAALVPLLRTASPVPALSFVEVADTAQAQRDVRAGGLSALVTGLPESPQVLTRRGLDPAAGTAIEAAAREAALSHVLGAAAGQQGRVQQALDAARPTVVVLDRQTPDQTRRLVIGFAAAFLLYYSLVLFGQSIARGVVEEKSSRVVELLLATVRPWQLLVGKVVGIGAVGLLQILVLGAGGLGAALLVHAVALPSLPIGALAWTVVWYLLGLGLYATVFAGAGALVSRHDELQGVLTPLLMGIALVFFAGVELFLQNPSNAVLRVLSLVPPFSPILMPSRLAVGVPAWQTALSLALAAAAIAAVTWLGGILYTNAVLRTGARVRLREALRSPP